MVETHHTIMLLRGLPGENGYTSIHYIIYSDNSVIEVMKMVTLDFSNCKTKEDVDAVYKEKEKELEMARECLEEVKKHNNQ